MATAPATAPPTVRLLSAGIIEHLFDDVAQSLRRVSGIHVAARFNPTGNIVRWVESGEPCDVVVLAAHEAMAGLIERGLVERATNTVFAKAVIGVAVKDGAPGIDLSSGESLRQAMLSARSFAHADPDGGSSSGAHVRRLIARLGIEGSVAGKVVMRSRGQSTIRAVAEGLADFVVAQATEIAAVPGVRYVGDLPAGLQVENYVSAAVRTGCTVPDAAKQLVEHLASPALWPHWQGLGFARP